MEIANWRWSAVSLGARITQHSFQIMQKQFMQIFIPDEHALKVPEIRLPHECDSPAEPKDRAFIAENEILWIWMSKANTAFNPLRLFNTSFVFQTKVCIRGVEILLKGRDLCQAEPCASLSPWETLLSTKQLGCWFSCTFEKLSHSQFPASVLE